MSDFDDTAALIFDSIPPATTDDARRTAQALSEAGLLYDNTWLAENYQREQLRRVKLQQALAVLVDLKDGPRGEDYERRKPLAWEQARRTLAEVRS